MVEVPALFSLLPSHWVISIYDKAENCVYTLETGDSWSEHHNAVSGWKQDEGGEISL